MSNVDAPWTKYVALGDSFTEGLWDYYPLADGTVPIWPDAEAYPTELLRLRGWADRLADHLSATRAANGQAPLQYANLAVRGRLLSQVLAEQLPVALEMKPDLVSLVAGGNDLLRPGGRPDELAQRLEQAVITLRQAGCEVLLATNANSVGSPVIGWTRGKFAAFNMSIWSLARRHGAHVVDLWGLDALQDWRQWSVDRIHLSPQGHTLIGHAAAQVLGLVVPDGWDAPLPGPRPRPSARENAAWLRTHVVPWATRRFRHQSSGDARVAKLPELTPWPAPHA